MRAISGTFGRPGPFKTARRTAAGFEPGGAPIRARMSLLAAEALTRVVIDQMSQAELSAHCEAIQVVETQLLAAYNISKDEGTGRMLARLGACFSLAWGRRAPTIEFR